MSTDAHRGKHKWDAQTKSWQAQNKPARTRLVEQVFMVNHSPAGVPPNLRPVVIRVPDPREYKARLVTE